MESLKDQAKKKRPHRIARVVDVGTYERGVSVAFDGEIIRMPIDLAETVVAGLAPAIEKKLRWELGMADVVHVVEAEHVASIRDAIVRSIATFRSAGT